jgi:hypothetical protein
MPSSTQAEKQFIQEAHILVTGRLASQSEVSLYQNFISNGNYARLDALIDDYMNALTPAAGGVQKLLQTIAKNGLGMTISDQDAPAIVQYLMNSVRITSWSQLLHWLSDYQGDFGDTLTNKGTAANNFLALLDTAGKNAFLNGAGPTVAATNLLQSIGSSAASLVKANSDFAALSSNLTAAGIKSLVVDGYIKDATVFIDTNGDGQLSAGEWSTKTDASGGYVLPSDAKAGGIVAFGGTDLLTGKSFQGVLTAPAGSTVVNPLTTMVQAVLADSKGGLSVAEATASVSKALSLPADVSILSYDPLAVLASTTSTAAAKATALATQTVALQVSNIITQVGSTIDAGSTKVNNLSAASAVTSALAGAISTASSTVSGKVDLNSATTIQALVQTAATSAGATTVISQASQLASVTSASNTSASSAKTIEDLAKSAVVSQGSATDSLVAGINSGSLTAAVTSFTGAALTNSVSSAKPAEIAPGVPTPVTPAPVVPPSGGGGGGGGSSPTPVGSLSYTGQLLESSANDGSITGRVLFSLQGDSFTGAIGSAIAGVSISNVPLGLTVRLVKLSTSEAELTLTGATLLNGTVNDVNNLTVNFGSTSFAVANASLITGSNQTGISIKFTAGSGTLTSLSNSATTESDFINGNQGTVTGSALTFNAAEGSDQFYFNLDVANNTANVVINGFGANDKLVFKSEAAASFSSLASIYSISDNLTDITLVANQGGSVQQIKLAGITHATTINSFDALASLLGSGTIVVSAASVPGAGTRASPTANETQGNDVINANQRSVVSAPKEFNAANGNDQYVLNTTVAENAANIRISNFGAGDQLVFVSSSGTTNLNAVNAIYSVSDNLQDVTLTANVGGSVQSVTLVGITGSRAAVYGAIDSITELASFLGAGSLVFA